MPTLATLVPRPTFAALLAAVLLLAASARSLGAEERFDRNGTEWGLRWFPTHVHFGPDNDTLLVGLCHVKRVSYCRIGKYRIGKDQWEILPFDEKRTYNNPVFSPDGQWIVYSGAPCDGEARCTAADFKLYKARPDGSQPEVILDAPAVHPAFSHDGRKLIYWKWKVIDKPGMARFVTSQDLYQLEWATGKETALTRIGFAGTAMGKPFFTPDGERFVFAAQMRSQWEGMVSCTDEPPNPPYRGTRKNFGYLFGKGNDAVTLFSATMKQVPISQENCKQWDLLWDNNSYEPLDMDRQGRILYLGYLAGKKRQGNPVALALRPPEPGYRYQGQLLPEEERRRYPFARLTDEQLRRGEGTALYLKQQFESDTYRAGEGVSFFLRKPLATARDEQAFDKGGCSNSLSPDGKRIAFVVGNCSRPSNVHGMALLASGQSFDQALLFRWPTLTLKPGLVTQVP